MTNVEWVDRRIKMPTMAEADYNCSLWVSGVAENTGKRMVGMMPYEKAVEALNSGICDFWADTGLRMPEPPQIPSIDQHNRLDDRLRKKKREGK